MKICFYTHISPNPQLGGVERVTYNLSKFFDGKGIEVYNLTSKGDLSDCRIPDDLNMTEKSNFVNSFLRKNDIDIIIDQYNCPYIKHPEIEKSVKIVKCYHLNPFAKHLIRSLLETFSIRTLKYSLLNIAFILNSPRRKLKQRRLFQQLTTNGSVDKIVYLSQSYILPNAKRNKASLSLFCAIPNALENSLLYPPPLQVPKNKTVIWCGRIVQNPKNILFLPKLWEGLMAKHPDWNFIIIGDGIDRQLLEQKIEKKHLERITITGYVDPYQYYKNASIIVLPSYSEGFSMVLIEAMSQGCVPVVFDNSSVYHDYINQENGCIVADMDKKAFIMACDLLMSDERLLAEKSIKAQRNVQKFNIENIGHEWLNLFSELTGD